MQFLGVQHAQICVSLLDVVHVLHGQLQTRQDNLSVCCDLWVGGDGGGVVEVSKAAKVPLSPGVYDQTPEETQLYPSVINIKIFNQSYNTITFSEKTFEVCPFKTVLW
uniref:Uncharacterized protein n=1 Tax=Oryzias latipes TaxID=8090 RepID=A0A3P9I9M7_ORYLA